MKYTSEIVIDLPREAVIRALDNPDNMKHWQKGLMGYKVIEGTPGEKGAKMELEYQMGKRNMVMVETIIKNEFPAEFHAHYDAKGVHNEQRNYFYEMQGGKTKWVSDSEFKFAGVGMKIIGFLMPGAFKKQSIKYLNDFKNFAEKGTSVAEQ